MPRNARSDREELRMVQDEMLHAAHELTLVQARIHRLRARVELPGDDIDDDALRRSLSFEVHGDLETATEDLGNAVHAMRRGGLKTEEILERAVLKEDNDERRQNRRKQTAGTESSGPKS